MLLDEIIDSGLFDIASGQVFDKTDSAHIAMQRLYLSSAARTVGDYLRYDISEASAGTVIKGRFMSITLDEAAIDQIKHTVIRIATLMNQEAGGHIGVNTTNDFNGGRTYLNVVDYTPYLLPLAPLCLIGGIEAGGAA